MRGFFEAGFVFAFVSVVVFVYLHTYNWGGYGVFKARGGGRRMVLSDHLKNLHNLPLDCLASLISVSSTLPFILPIPCLHKMQKTLTFSGA